MTAHYDSCLSQPWPTLSIWLQCSSRWSRDWTTSWSVF